MRPETLTTAVLGLNDAGRQILRTAAATGLFRIVAVADQDALLAERIAGEYDCQAHGDFRQMIVQNHLDCLIVAAETHNCDEQIKTALKRGYNVLKLAPPARTFEEALEYIQMAEGQGVQFAVASPARFRSSYQETRELLSQGCVAHPFLVAASCSFGTTDRPAWQSDPKLAGGGVLLQDCYHTVDQVLWNFPLPGQIYALQTNAAPDKQQRLSRTEDTAVVCLKFSDALMGSMIATRGGEPAPDRATIEIHGRDARLTVTPTEVVLSTQAGDDDGQTWRYDEDGIAVEERMLTAFARSILAPDAHRPIVTAAETLRNMAVLQSAYLSARTGFPEEPARILQLAGNLVGTAANI